MERHSTADLDDSSKYSNRSVIRDFNALRTVEGKGSVSTEFAHGLVGPNLSVNCPESSLSNASGRKGGGVHPLPLSRSGVHGVLTGKAIR